MNPIFVYYLVLIISPFIVGYLQQVIEIGLGQFIKNVKLPSVHKKRYLGLFLLFILITVLVSQALQFYLLNGAMFWLALLSFGGYLLYFIFPYFSLLIFWKPNSRLSKIGIGSIVIWSIFILNAKPIIYLDEGGVSSREANVPLKLFAVAIGIGLYIGLTMVQTLMTYPKVKKELKFPSKMNRTSDKITNLKRRVIIPTTTNHQILVGTSILSAFLPIIIVLIGWLKNFVITSSLPFLFGFTLIVLLVSLSNLIFIRSRWINIIYYFIYILIYLTFSYVIAPFHLLSMDSVDLILSFFPLSIHIALLVPFILNISKRLKNLVDKL